MARPALPLGARLPWVMAGVSLALLGYGLASDNGNEGYVVIGSVGLAGTFVAFVLPRVLLGRGD